MHSNLSLRMHALPLELFALIEDLVLDPDDTGNPRVISVDNVWCPPFVHQLNTATRRTHTAAYYATHIFDFSGQADTTTGVELCARWLKHLPRSSQAKIRHIRIAASYDLPPSPPLDCSNLWNRILQCPNEKSVRLDLNVFQPVTCRRLVDWTSRQAVKIGLLLTEESLSRFIWENGGLAMAHARAYGDEGAVVWSGWGGKRGVGACQLL